MAAESPSTSPKYTLVRCIAHSNSGDVFLGEDDKTGEEVAIHVIDLEKIESEDLTVGSRRIVLHSQCNTPLMKSFVGSYVIPNTAKLCHVSEYLEYSAKQVLRTHGTLSECAISEVMTVVLGCLKYLHKKGIAHNDIKAENILLDKTASVIKLNSFSTFLHPHPSPSASEQALPYWSAPEAVLEEGKTFLAETSTTATSQDIWSVGIAALELAGHLPYVGMDHTKAFFLLREGKSIPVPKHLSKTFHDFISACLVREPSSRPTAKELLKHKFISKLNKGPKLQDYVRALRKQNKLIALTPRFGINVPERSDARGEDTQWEFEKEEEGEDLVLLMIDRISRQMSKVLCNKARCEANKKEDRGARDESFSSLKEELEQNLARVREIYSLFSPVEQKQIEDSFSLFLEKHATIRLSSEAFGAPAASLRNTMDVNAYMKLGLFSRFVIKRWKENVIKNKF